MSIASSIFGAAQAKLLASVFGHPGRWFHVNELKRATGLASASLQRELKKLETARLVRIEHLGNLKRFQANEDSPVFTELQSLVRKTLGVDAVLTRAMEPFGDKLQLAVLYGSVAKQTDRATSDIDLLVVSDEVGLVDLLPPLLDAEAQLDRKINPTMYGTAEFARSRNDPSSFVSKVLSGPHQTLVGAKGS